MKQLKLFSALLMCLFALGFTACSNDDDEESGGGANVYDQAVDLGLSVKWATCNVGAESPEEYGDYFAWGETEPKGSYTQGNCKTWDKDFDDISGNPTYDAATANLGNGWRMPTAIEMQELVDNCAWEWTTQNNVNGYKVTSKKNGNSIFLPAAGECHGVSIDDADRNGNYWSSTPNDFKPSYMGYQQLAYMLEFGRSYLDNVDFEYRHNGMSVRPVRE